MRAAGFVLTGGKSSRMGRDKAMLKVDDQPLVQAIASLLSTVAHPVTLIGHPQRYSALTFPCLPDLRPGLGPLAGIETALTHTSCEWNLIVACDMPGLQQDWLRRLLDHARKSSASCVITRDTFGYNHPLCAVYRQKCLANISSSLDAGQLKLNSLIDNLDSDYLEATDGLENINTPLEWERWRTLRAKSDNGDRSPIARDD